MHYVDPIPFKAVTGVRWCGTLINPSIPTSSPVAVLGKCRAVQVLSIIEHAHLAHLDLCHALLGLLLTLRVVGMILLLRSCLHLAAGFPPMRRLLMIGPSLTHDQLGDLL